MQIILFIYFFLKKPSNCATFSKGKNRFFLIYIVVIIHLSIHKSIY